MELAGEEGLRAETPGMLQPLSQHSCPCPWEPHGELPAPKKGRAGEAPPTQVKRLQPDVDNKYHSKSCYKTPQRWRWRPCPSVEGCVPAGMHPQWDGGFAASQPSLLQRYTNNHVGKIFHRTGMEINGLPEPSVYLFIPIPAVRFLPYLNSISKALPLLI